MNNYVSLFLDQILIFCFRIPPILSDKRITTDRRISNLESSGASIQPTRTASSAKSSRSAAVVLSNSRVHSSPTLRKGRRKNATNHRGQDLLCCPDGPSNQISDSKKSQTNDVTNTLPRDVKLSAEVIVSNGLKFKPHIICISLSVSAS